MICYQVFCKFLKIFFKDLLRASIKLQLKFAQIFILVYLKIFLQISEVLLNFFDTQIIFLTKLIVSNFICLNFFYIVLRKTIYKIPVFSKFVPKFHKFYLKFCQAYSKVYPKLHKDFLYLFQICVFFEFRENLLKILINYFESEFVNKKIILLMHYPSLLVHSAFSSTRDRLNDHLISLSNLHIFQDCADFPTLQVGNTGVLLDLHK